VLNKEVKDVVASLMYNSEFGNAKRYFDTGIPELFKTLRQGVLHNMMIEVGVLGRKSRDGKPPLLVCEVGLGTLSRMVEYKHMAEGNHIHLTRKKLDVELFPGEMDSIAIKVCKWLAQKGGQDMRAAKRAARVRFVRRVGYVFWPWGGAHEGYKESLRICREESGTDPSLNLAKVEGGPHDASPENRMRKYLEWLGKQEEMMYFVEHDVNVYNAERRRGGFERKRIMK